MMNSRATILSFELLKNINFVRGKFSINDLEETIITLVFFKYFGDNISDLNNFKLRNNVINLFSSVQKKDYISSFFGVKEFPVTYLVNAIEDLEEDNKSLVDVFSSFDFKKFNNDKHYADVLKSLMQVISEMNLDTSDLDFGEFIDHLLRGIIAAQGKGSDSLQPKELSDLMFHFIPIKQHLTVYNPFSGFASLGLQLPVDALYYGEEKNRKVCVYSRLRLLAYKIKNKYIIHNADVFESWSTNDNKFDFIVTNPSFNLKLYEFDEEFNVDDQFFNKNNANSFIVSQCYKRLNPEIGKAVIVLPNSFLNSQNIKEKALREYLINQGALEMVISLPGGILNYTSIPFNLLILSNSSEKKEPIFVDTRHCFKEVSRSNKILDLDRIFSILNSDNEFKKKVKYADIIEADFSFIPDRYLSTPSKLELEPGYELKTLGSLTELISRKRPEPGLIGRLVKIRDLSDNVLTYQKDFNNLEPAEIPSSANSSASILPDNTLLLSLRWKTLKPTFFTKSNSAVFYPSYDISAFKVRETLVDLDYLILELEKDYVLRQIEAERMGTSIPFISRDRLLGIEIKVPSLEQQKADVKLVKDTIVNAKLKELGLEEQFAKLKKEQIEDLSLKKHNIMQHLNNMQSSLDSLTMFMGQNNGLLEADKIIYPKFGTTVAKRFQLLAESLSEAIYFVDNITNEISFNPPEFVNAHKLLTICEEKGIKKEYFDFDTFYDKDTFIIDSEEQEPIIKFSKLDFLELYNNILENAILHGFTDTSNKYLFKTEVKYDQELNKVVISFLNNGKPFPKGMAERYQIKGEKAGATGNKGIGSWKVFEIAKHFGAEVKVYDLEGEEFPVRIDLLLNLENE